MHLVGITHIFCFNTLHQHVNLTALVCMHTEHCCLAVSHQASSHILPSQWSTQQAFRTPQHVVIMTVQCLVISVRITSKKDSTLFTGSQPYFQLRSST